MQTTGLKCFQNLKKKKKKKEIENCYCYIQILYEICIEMSTNKLTMC